jgi:hypothetical protein
LTSLDCSFTKVADLSPLKDMKLTDLWCYFTNVSDLSPLKDMKLTHLNFDATSVSDLAPLKDMPLKELHFNTTKVSDLSPLRNMQLTSFSCRQTKVSDLSVVRDMPLKEITCDLHGERDLKILRSLKTLEQINEKPAAAVLGATATTNAAFEQWIAETQKLPAEKQVAAVVQKLQERNPGFDGKETHKLDEKGEVGELKFNTDAVSDLWPVRALPQIRHLECRGTVGPDGQPHGKVTSLAALEGTKLYVLACSGNPITDLSPLKNTPINALVIANTSVADLKQLEGMPLVMLDCAMNDGRRVFDLTPVQKAPLKELWLVYRPERHAEILKDVPTLQKINGKPAVEVLKASSPAE